MATLTQTLTLVKQPGPDNAVLVLRDDENLFDRLLGHAATRYGLDADDILDVLRTGVRVEWQFRDRQGHDNYAAWAGSHTLQVSRDHTGRVLHIGCKSCRPRSIYVETGCPGCAAVAVHLAAADLVGDYSAHLVPAPAPDVDPVEVIAADLLTEHADLGEAFSSRLLRAVGIVKSGDFTSLAKYGTVHHPEGYWGVWDCDCPDCEHRGLRAPRIGTVCKHTLTGVILERLRQAQDSVAHREWADEWQRKAQATCWEAANEPGDDAVEEQVFVSGRAFPDNDEIPFDFNTNSRETALPAQPAGSIEDWL